MARILLDAREDVDDRALFTFERLEESSVVENQHAGDADFLVAHARAHQQLLQVGGRKILAGGAGVDNLIHAGSPENCPAPWTARR